MKIIATSSTAVHALIGSFLDSNQGTGVNNHCFLNDAQSQSILNVVTSLGL